MVVGSIALYEVPDAVGVLGDYAELYPDVSTEAWEPYGTLYPELFSGAGWRVPCMSFLVRSEDATILVDTGVGPPGLWDWTAEDEGRLPGALGELGVSPDGIDVVFFTHLHIDHVGWNSDLEGVAFFPRARYVVHRDAVTFVRTHDTRPHVRRCILAIVDRFETIAREVELAPGVTAFVLAGHYPGHMGLRLSSGGKEAVLIADAAMHPALLQEPDWGYVSDVSSAVAAETRRVLLSELVDRDVLVACGHYPGSGIGRAITRDGRVVWEEA